MSNKPLKKTPVSKELKPQMNLKQAGDPAQLSNVQSKLKLDPSPQPHPHTAKDKS